MRKVAITFRMKNAYQMKFPEKLKYTEKLSNTKLQKKNPGTVYGVKMIK